MHTHILKMTDFMSAAKQQFAPVYKYSHPSLHAILLIIFFPACVRLSSVDLLSGLQSD